MKREKIKKFFSSRTGKSIVVVASVLVIALAVYLNYRWFYDPLGSLGYGEGNMQDNFNDSQNASGESGTEDYFTQTSLTRQESRDEAMEVLKSVTEDANATEEAKAEARAMLAKIASDIQNEANIETLVKAKGFEECIAVISEDSVSIIVKAEQLQAAQAAQIFSIAYETTGINPENISIINK
ncbi:MAG: SpoIIIAH-like family protein [Clostridia bacterium]|nr:SpoIIIAH-like family protein [Clostridia bacterium]